MDIVLTRPRTNVEQKLDELLGAIERIEKLLAAIVRSEEHRLELRKWGI